MCAVKRMGVWWDLCWEQEWGGALGREVAISSGSREAPPIRLALQVAAGSLQAHQVLTSQKHCWKSSQVRLQSVCWSACIYLHGLGSLPSGAQLAPGGQNRLETPHKGTDGINAATTLFARHFCSIPLPCLLPASPFSPGSWSEQALWCAAPRTTAALFKWLLSAAIISLINKTWLADTDLLERAKGAVAPSLVSPGAACVLLIMWHSGGCLVIHDEATATPRMRQGSQGFFFFSCVNNRNLQEKKKRP